MKFLFRVTVDEIATLLRGKDFTRDNEKITLADGSIIPIKDLGEMLFNAELDYVIFTDDLCKCKDYMHQIRMVMVSLSRSDSND